MNTHFATIPRSPRLHQKLQPPTDYLSRHAGIQSGRGMPCPLDHPPQHRLSLPPRLNSGLSRARTLAPLPTRRDAARQPQNSFFVFLHPKFSHPTRRVPPQLPDGPPPARCERQAPLHRAENNVYRRRGSQGLERKEDRLWNSPPPNPPAFRAKRDRAIPDREFAAPPRSEGRTRVR